MCITEIIANVLCIIASFICHEVASKGFVIIVGMTITLGSCKLKAFPSVKNIKCNTYKQLFILLNL